MGYGGLLGKIQMLKLNFETFELLIQTVEGCVIFELFEEEKTAESLDVKAEL